MTNGTEGDKDQLRTKLDQMNRSIRDLRDELDTLSMEEIESRLTDLARAKWELLGDFPSFWGEPFSVWYARLSAMDRKIDFGRELTYSPRATKDDIRGQLTELVSEKRKLEDEIG